jgi:hypothetical protein
MMDLLKEYSGGVFTCEDVPPEHHAAILEVVRQWQEEKHFPEVYW